MNKNAFSKVGHLDLQLALKYLKLKGISGNHLATSIHVSTHTLSLINQGNRVTPSTHEALYRLLMARIDAYQQRTQSPEALVILTEVGRLHAGLPPRTALLTPLFVVK